jgi:hypothetical protein
MLPDRAGGWRWGELAAAVALTLCLASLGWLAEPRFAGAQEEFSADSAAADSARQAYQDSAARADSLAQLGITEPESRPPVITSSPQAHPFTYSTNYNILRNRRTWGQDASLYVTVGDLAISNRTNIVISEDPAVQRDTRNRSTELELGYVFFPWLTSGFRLAVSRNSDIIGIRLSSSIERAEDRASGFFRLERSVIGRFPVTLDLSFGGLQNKQPEFSRRGYDWGLDFSTVGPLARNVDLSAGAVLSASQLVSETPQELGGTFTSNDRNTDRSGRLGLTWTPNSLLNLSVNGAVRRGILNRPSTVFGVGSAGDTTVAETVSTNAENANATIRFSAPWGGSFTASGRASDTQIVYDVETSRNNINRSRNMQLQLTDRFLGADVDVNFQNGISESDFTERADGYVQSQWNRSMELRTRRSINRRTGTNLRGAVSLNSRRFKDFRPSSAASFPPADQDLFRASGAAAIDYRPIQKFTTGLEGQVDLNRTINLTSATSINNTDQTGYRVIWTWSLNPIPIWTVTQNNSAGAQQIAYPFAPDRDQLSFIYGLRTSSTLRVTAQVNFEMHYNIRYQSRGSFREDLTTGERLFGKTGGSDQYDLLLRVVYRPLDWLNMEVSQQSFITQNLSETDGESRIDSETRRQVLLMRVGAAYNFTTGSALNINIRHSLTSDATQINTVIPTPPTVREDQLWQVTSSFRTFFDF